MQNGKDMKRVLIVPMLAMAETAGSFSRVRLLANALLKAGHEVAVCCAKDINYNVIEGTKEYPLSVPVPLGLPAKIGKYMFPLAQKLGITSVKRVNSYEEVLFLTGNTDYSYLVKSVDEIRYAIKEYRPDIVYSEFNISAIIAAKFEGKQCFISASVPTQAEFCRQSERYTSGMNRLLAEHGLNKLSSCMDVFEWADKRFVPSCYELEPIEAANVVYCGALKKIDRIKDDKRDKILVYMGNGTVSVKKMLREVTKAFRESRYEIYIAGRGLKENTQGNIHTSSYMDFSGLLPQSVLYINHGGQNSITDGLIYGVPLLICPGKVFERKYNAASIVNTGAGLQLSYEEFTADRINECAETIIGDDGFAKHAMTLGRRLLQLGGVDNIVRECEKT